LGVTSALSTIVQLALLGGVGGIVVVKHAIRGITISDVKPKAKPSFPSEYDELMWLEEKQKDSLTEEETLRFYELRDKWPEMHLDHPTSSSS